MSNEKYFNLVIYNYYEDLDYLQLCLQIIKKEFENSNLSNNTHRKLFLTSYISIHNKLFNACLNNNLLDDIFSINGLLDYIRNKFKDYKTFIESKSNTRIQIFSKIENSFSNMWPNEFPTLGFYKNEENSCDKISMYDYSLFVLKNTYKNILYIKNMFPNVYYYLIELYQLPKDFKVKLCAFVYLLENNIKKFPLTKKGNFAKFDNNKNRF